MNALWVGGGGWAVLVFVRVWWFFSTELLEI